MDSWDIAGWATPWVGYMVEASARAAAVLAAAWVASLLLRRRAAALRHLIWIVALAGAVLAPVSLGFAPRIRVPALWPAAIPATAASTAATAEGEALEGSALGSPDRWDAGLASPPAVPATAGPPRAAPDHPPAVEKDTAPAEEIAAGVLLFIWMAGCLVVLARIVIGNLRLRRLTRRATPLPTAGLPGCALGTRRPVRFLQAAGEIMPMTWGWRNPIVLLPASFEMWEKERREMTIHHELAHIRRADGLTQTLARTAAALYWFHPLVWLALRRLRVEADQAADDMVLAAGAKPSRYAGHLVRAAREYRRAGLQPWAALAMSLPSSLDERVGYLLDTRVKRGVPGGPGRLAAVLGALAIVLIVPAGEAVGQTPDPAPLPAPTEPAGVPVAPRLAPFPEAAPALPEPAEPPPVPQPPLRAQAQQPPSPAAPVVAAPPVRAEEKVRRIEEKVRLAEERARSLSGKLAAAERPRLSPEAARTAGAALRKALQSPDAQVRAEAAEALGRLGSPETENLEALRVALSDSEPRVRINAVKSLGRLLRSDKQLSPEAALRFLDPALASADPALRRETAEVLGSLRGQAAIEATVRLLEDSDPQVQREAIESLGKVLRAADAETARTALPALERLLRHPNAAIRRQTVETLGELWRIADQVVPLLAGAVEDPDPVVQRHAVEAIGNISSPETWTKHRLLGNAIDEGIRELISGAVGGVITGQVAERLEQELKGAVAGTPAAR